MNKHIENHQANNITQKDLLKLLFDQAQHNATREEVNSLEVRLNQRIDKLDTRIDNLDTSLNQRIDKLDGKFDKLNWLLIVTLVGVISSLVLQVVR